MLHMVTSDSQPSPYTVDIQLYRSPGLDAHPDKCPPFGSSHDQSVSSGPQGHHDNFFGDCRVNFHVKHESDALLTKKFVIA